MFLDKKEKNLIANIISPFIMVIAFLTLEPQESNEQLRHYLVLLLLDGFTVVICWVYYFYHRLSIYNREKRELQYFNSNFSKQKEYMESLTTTITELRILRHDVKAQYCTIYAMMKSDKKEEAILALETINIKSDENAALEKTTNNDGLNALLIKTVQNCKSNYIKFYYVIDSSVEKILGTDLGVIFYNLLNNVVEACRKVDEKREISLEAEEYKNYLRCKISNSIG